MAAKTCSVEVVTCAVVRVKAIRLWEGEHTDRRVRSNLNALGFRNNPGLYSTQKQSCVTQAIQTIVLSLTCNGLDCLVLPKHQNKRFKLSGNPTHESIDN